MRHPHFCRSTCEVSIGRRFAGALLVLLLGALPQSALAARVVALKTSDIAAYNLALEGFQSDYQGELIVHDLGHGGELDERLAAQIRDSRPDVILAVGSKAATTVAGRIKDYPIVFCMVLNPEKRGLKGRNITGVSLEIPPQEQLRQFLRVVPGLQRVGLLYNPAKSGALVVEARQAATKVGLALEERTISGAGEVPDALKGLLGRVDGLWLIPDASVVTHETFNHILVVSLERKLPLMVFNAAFVKAGALLGVTTDYAAIGKEAAALVGEVLRGRTAGDVPLRDPPSGIVINETTATRIGLELGADLRQGTTIVK